MRINQNNFFFVKRFSYDDSRKTFYADISDLVGKGFFSDLVRKLYDDAVDVGFGIMNNKTQKTVYFVFSHEETDGEGEVIRWHFTSIPNEVCSTPLHCVVNND